MKTFEFQYPGDPVLTVTVYNRQEFLERYPRKPIQLIGPEGVVESIPIPANTICCDWCNKDPEDEIYMVEGLSHAWCAECAEKTLLPHKLEDSDG